ncbi:MAG TPA: nitrilase-related carbon-nitrogen hydrolase [Terriglobales bacterium]|nr:nitrilase-related carbon-nitrogen hydrolase [Terriglobales bacterium]
MKLCLVQLRPQMLAVGANLEAALARMEAAGGADLYLLPELYASGYTFARQEEVEAVAEEAGAGPSYDAMAGFARRRGAHVVYGFAERGGGRCYNSANVVGPEGLVGTYRKIHLFAREKLFFAAGGAPAPVYELPWGRMGVMVCFDWYFPEVARGLALRGAELLVQPANLVLPHCPQAMITRSLENRIFSATCDRVGTENHGGVSHSFIGSSQVVSPAGEVLVRLSREEEETAVVELDLAAARSKQVGQYNDLFGDRQAGLYS